MLDVFDTLSYYHHSFLKVLIADALVYIPAVLVFCFVCLGRKPALNKVRFHFLGYKKLSHHFPIKVTTPFTQILISNQPSFSVNLNVI